MILGATGRVRAVALGAVALLAAACGGGATSSAQSTPAPTASPPTNARLTVFAAASLKDAIEQAVAAYHEDHPGIEITISTDSSAALEVQIEQGAPADVFLSADTANPDKLVAARLAAGDPVPFAGNELAIVVPLDNPGSVQRPADLARPGLRIIAAGDEVPISAYAREVVANLASVPGYPSGFAAAYTANVVSKEDNVRAVVAKIELGEGDAAIVYATDAAASGKVEIVEIPGSANVEATYAGVVVSTSKEVAAAQAFLDWLAGPRGYGILADLGFLPPS